MFPSFPGGEFVSICEKLSHDPLAQLSFTLSRVNEPFLKLKIVSLQ